MRIKLDYRKMGQEIDQLDGPSVIVIEPEHVEGLKDPDDEVLRAIVIASECWDGIPEHGLYGQLLREAESPEDLLQKIHTPGFLRHDQWQAQIQAQIQLKADVWVYSHNLISSQIESVQLKKSDSIERTVKKLAGRYGRNTKVCVLPKGPQTIPYLK